MKEQILHLDPHDDYLSARDKMGWTQTGRVLLVWPASGRVLTRKLDLVHLHRHAATLGAQLGLVTPDAEVRDLAGELGLPCFDSVEDGHRLQWRYRKPRREWATSDLHSRTAPRVRAELLPRPALALPRVESAPDASTIRDLLSASNRLLRPLVFLAAVTVFALAVLVILPTATVTLAPASQAISVTMPIVAAVDGLDTSSLPAREIATDVEATLRIPTTGQTEVPSTKAAGSVLFTNLIGQNVRVPKGTGVRTTSGSQIRYETTVETTLPAQVGATANVPVQAVTAGPQGNVAAQQINAIDGPLGLQLAVINAAPTTGGGLELRAAVTEEDHIAVRDLLLVQLRQTALADLTARLTANELLPPATLSVTNILAETYDRFPGEVSDTVALTLRLRATALAVDESTARSLAFQRLAGQIGAGFALVTDSETYTRLSEPVANEQGQIRFDVRADARIAPVLDPSAIQLSLRGKTPREASRWLTETLRLQRAPDITLWPQWYPFLPLLNFRTTVIVSGG